MYVCVCCLQTQREYSSQMMTIVQQHIISSGGLGAGRKTGGGKRTGSTMKFHDSTVMSEGMEGGGGEGEKKTEAHVYVEARTYVYLEIELKNPLIPKRPASVLAQR